MKIIARAAWQGKTTELIRLVAEEGDGARLVVANQRKADQVEEKARLLGLKIKRPFTYTNVQLGMAVGVNAVYLDDLDAFARFFVGNTPIAAATITYKPVMGYICAVCGVPAESELVDLDTGATLTCDECGGKTVVVLQSAESYTAV